MREKLISEAIELIKRLNEKQLDELLKSFSEEKKHGETEAGQK